MVDMLQHPVEPITGNALEEKVPEPMIPVGTRVAKVGGDYRFDGIVVASFTKLSGVIRYAVEDDRGVLHIYGPKNLRIKEEGEA